MAGRTELERRRADVEAEVDRLVHMRDTVAMELERAHKRWEEAQLRLAQVLAQLETLEREGDATQEATFQEYVSGQVKGHRARLDYRQEDLAAKMREAGFRWQRITVAEVERRSRRVSLDEVVQLSMLFSVPALDLLVPEGAAVVLLDVGRGDHLPVDAAKVRTQFVHGTGD